MSKKALKLGAATILALGAGAAVVSKKNKRNEQRKVTKDIQERAKTLINIAHPDHRETLDKAAFERFGPHFHYVWDGE